MFISVLDDETDGTTMNQVLKNELEKQMINMDAVKHI
jgi:hypothetical protein